MGCRLRIFLTDEEKLTLEELRKATSIPQRTKDRAQVLLLNARGLKNEQIAQGLNWAISTVRQTLHRWEKMGLAGLWDAPGRGGKPRYSEDDLEYLENCLFQEPQQTYNSKQLAKKLASERQVYLSADRLRRVLKERGKVINTRKTSNNHEV
ncbi:helix-turn-helix domain-containing protein [Anabaena sp. UHCC 0204]|uniref:helix-turn-helix domain-containing protein n=2 Tax=unclassified Anabaena TaxID=2619674 RepID=UPI001447812A|nr:helix-turn-helix domain-containing protein [Anabaena sp. UHCC 0204]MTJ08628.1 helix-turn-helix domain-containing protein [Anabaena sp. UHCC 0204]